MGVVKTFLLPSYGFSFGYKRKGVSFAEVTEAQSNIVGHKICAPFTSVLVCTSEQTATSRYLSLSRGVLILFHRDSSLLRGSRGGSAAYHSFSAVQKV